MIITYLTFMHKYPRTDRYVFGSISDYDEKTRKKIYDWFQRVFQGDVTAIDKASERLLVFVNQNDFDLAKETWELLAKRA